MDHHRSYSLTPSCIHSLRSIPTAPSAHSTLLSTCREEFGTTVYSSKYNGLEKEVLDESTSTTQASSQSAAGYYEGDDCERVLQEKYTLLEALGVGSTSTVYRCLCRTDNRE